MNLPQPPLPEPLGMLINNRYKIQKLLGRGGFGQTYLAYDTQCFNHPCVLKEFAPASGAEYAVQKARELFEREARVLYEIDHPQIPKFLAWFVDQGRLFLVQEYITGKTYAQLLRQRQQQGQTFAEAEVIQWLLDLLPVLQYLHQRQIVHRDISPDNIMLPDGLGTRPILIDFGLVKQTLNQLRSEIGYVGGAASFVGKFGYAPPEQMRMGQCFPSSDIYALGVTALVLLTGQEPRLLMNQDSLEWHWQPYIKISPILAQVLERMLCEKPKARYQSAGEILAALKPIIPRSTSPHLTGSLLLSSPPPLPPLSSSPTPPFVDLPPAFLQQCQQELTCCIGPIASFVLENTLTQNPQANPAQLIEELALEIPDPAQASRFKTNLLNALPSLLAASTSRISRAMRSPQKTSLSPDFVERCNQALTRCIGPVASMILEDVLMNNPAMTPQQLVEAIAAEIPDSQQAQAFQKSMQ